MRMPSMKLWLAGLITSMLPVAGCSYAQGRVTIILFDLSLSESELTREILALKARMSTL